MRLIRPSECAYLAATSRSTIDRMVGAGVLPSVTLHQGKTKRTYRLRGADVSKVFSIPLADIEAFVKAQDQVIKQEVAE